MYMTYNVCRTCTTITKRYDIPHYKLVSDYAKTLRAVEATFLQYNPSIKKQVLSKCSDHVLKLKANSSIERGVLDNLNGGS